MENLPIENMDSELDGLYKSEGKEIVKNQLEADKVLAENLELVQKVLEGYYGKGMGEDMPLEEILGFFDAELENEDPQMDREDIKHAREFLLDRMPLRYTKDLPWIDLVENISEERKELEE